MPEGANVSCGTLTQKIGGCPEIHDRVGNGEVSLVGSNARNGSGSGGGQRADGTYTPAAPDPNAWNEEEARANGNYRPRFEASTPPTPPTAVTLSDIASFAPTVGGNHMEPNGWIVVGLDTNFYSDRSTRVVDGTLLGFPASVRFTPLSWRWSYGDGSATTSATPGASWAAQNLAEFAPSPTSHVFATAGSYAIDLTVGYAAQYRFAGSDWVAIAGTLELPANRIIATANDASTVLVNRDCRQNPEGPGC